MEGGGDDDAPGGRDESPSSADAATTSTDLPAGPRRRHCCAASAKQKIHWQPHEDALLLETVDRIGLGYWAAIAQAVGDTQQRCANRYRYLTSGKARKVQHPPPKASTWAPPLMVAPPAPPAQPPAPLAPAATAAASSGEGVVYVESTAIGDGEEDEAAVELVDCVALPNTAVHIRPSGAAVDPANLPPADMTTSTGIFAFRPDDRVPRLSADQLERVIDLLGRRCVADAENKRAVRTLVPLVRRLVGRGPHAESFAPAFTLGLHGASKVLNEAAVAELNVEMLVDLCDGEVQGAAVLSKTFTTATRGFVVLQLIAVEESVEKSGVGSRILEAACALAVEHDPSGSLLVPATAKWWEGTSKSGWLVEAKMAEHTRELSTLPCLFQMSVIKVLRWGCNEPRNGWLHAGPPQLPHQLAAAAKAATATAAASSRAATAAVTAADEERARDASGSAGKGAAGALVDGPWRLRAAKRSGVAIRGGRAAPRARRPHVALGRHLRGRAGADGRGQEWKEEAHRVQLHEQAKEGLHRVDARGRGSQAPQAAGGSHDRESLRRADEGGGGREEEGGFGRRRLQGVQRRTHGAHV